MARRFKIYTPPEGLPAAFPDKEMQAICREMDFFLPAFWGGFPGVPIDQAD